MGIITAIAIPQYVSYRKRAIDAVVRADLKYAATAQEDVFSQRSRYAQSVEELALGGYRRSDNVDLHVEGSQASFTITAQALAGCAEGSGVWTFSSQDGVIRGEACR